MLELGNNNGTIFNPKKFQFYRKEVEYAGHVISHTGIWPPEDMFRSIREFPTPKNITDVHAWFKMVVQVAFAFSELPTMALVRHLLNPKTRLHGLANWRKPFSNQKRQ